MTLQFPFLKYVRLLSMSKLLNIFSQNASICHVVFLKKKSYDGCSFVQWSPLFLNYSKTASGITLPWEWSKIYFEKWFGVLPKSNRFIIWKNSGNSKNTAKNNSTCISPIFYFSSEWLITLLIRTNCQMFFKKQCNTNHCVFLKKKLWQMNASKENDSAICMIIVKPVKGNGKKSGPNEASNGENVGFKKRRSSRCQHHKISQSHFAFEKPVWPV